MAKYKDGIQYVTDNVEFEIVATGTVNTVIGASNPSTAKIPQPTKNYRNLVLLVRNDTGQTITSFSVFTGSSIPTGASLDYLIFNGNTAGGIGTNSQGSVELSPDNANPFVGGDGCKIQFTMAAPTVAGTLKWALIGY